MRMVLALGLLSLPASAAFAASAGTEPVSARNAKCPGAASTHYAAVLREKGPPARTLDKEPPAKLVLSVHREWAGCPGLAVIREDIGATWFDPAPKRR